MGSRFSNDHTIEVNAHHVQDENEIEESIIEEEINNVASPASPMINSKTKGKGKMELKMMRPPKPFSNKQGSPREATGQTPFHLKFDTINLSAGKENNDVASIAEDIHIASATKRNT